jgi:pyruvate formate lyase activating enzyme
MNATCDICPHHCVLEEGATGRCRGRRNVNGVVTCANYGRLTAIALDPIEKKPLSRFHPGSWVLSVGSYGCNLRCPFCQNHDISMATGYERELQVYEVTPERLVTEAIKLADRGCIGLAFTYNEPLISYEYVRDCARLAHEHGLLNVVITNGMVCEGPLRTLLPDIDAFNIDLKGFTQRFYDRCGGDLETVKRSIEVASEQAHVEVTTLVVPGMNDSEDEIDTLASWLATVDPKTPYHLTRFFPRFEMLDVSPTPLQTMHELAAVARRHLDDVLLGNV